MLFSPIFTYLVYMQTIANILLCNLKKKKFIKRLFRSD